jgi:tyrosine-protein kinase Etk/Wzc
LAVSIASATGRPTLLIDGDMRSPDVHRIFDVDRGPGLSEVLQDECPVEEAIETGFSETLHLLTAGDLNISPHRVLGNNRFGALLKELGGMYDHIIIDTPPILAASEALLMASAADAAILCVRRDFSRLDQVGDAYARLMTAGVKTAGAVLNGIPARHYAYRYGSYYYNRDTAPAEAGASAASESGAV